MLFFDVDYKSTVWIVGNPATPIDDFTHLLDADTVGLVTNSLGVRSTGDRLWEKSPDGTIGRMLTVEDTVYVAVDGGEVVAYDTFDGSTRTTVSVAIEDPIGLTGSGDHLFVTGSTAPGVVALSTPHEEIGAAPDTDDTDGATICPDCGTSVEGEPNFCPDGSDLSAVDASGSDETFCPECGNAFSE